jgi:hypothetical protein
MHPGQEPRLALCGVHGRPVAFSPTFVTAYQRADSYKFRIRSLRPISSQLCGCIGRFCALPDLRYAHRRGQGQRQEDADCRSCFDALHPYSASPSVATSTPTTIAPTTHQMIPPP